MPHWLAYPLLGAVLALVGLSCGPFLKVWTGGMLFGRQVTRPPFNGRTAFTILVLGLDQPDKLHPELGRRTDTMLLAHVDLTTHMVTGVSIPRDTRVRLDGGHWTKINSAYTEGGPQASEAIVRDITGVNPDYYVVVDTASTKHLVDLVGGVDLTVDKRMKYDDNWQDLHIDLQPGYQHLDGEHAIEFLRFRHDRTGDIARMHRQQMFMRELAGRIVTPTNLPKMPWIVAELHRQVQTDIPDDDLLYLAKTMRNTPSSHLEFSSLEGESRMIHGISYFLPYTDKMKESLVKAFPGAIVPDSPDVDNIDTH